jgi:hypothetical protein
MTQQQLKEIAKKYDGRVALLLSLGRDSIQGRNSTIDYIEKFGFNDEDVAQLLMLAQDMEIYQFDYTDIAEDEGLEFFGVIHAWYVLSALKVPEAKQLFVDKLEDAIGYEVDEWMFSGFRHLITPYRKDMIGYMIDYINVESHNEWVRIEYIEVLKDMLEAKEVELSFVNLILEKLLTSGKNKIVTSGVISVCIDLKLICHHPLIVQCFADKKVDIDHVGDLEDVEIAMGLRTKRETVRELTEMQKTWSFLNDDMLDLSDEEEAMIPFVKDEPKIGRNDPCPCGSGKKYKKCCWGNANKS